MNRRQLLSTLLAPLAALPIVGALFKTTRTVTFGAGKPYEKQIAIVTPRQYTLGEMPDECRIGDVLKVVVIHDPGEPVMLADEYGGIPLMLCGCTNLLPGGFARFVGGDSRQRLIISARKARNKSLYGAVEISFVRYEMPGREDARHKKFDFYEYTADFE